MTSFFIITGGTIGIDAIFEQFQFIIAITQERQVKFHLTGIPIRQSAHIPIIT